jgi:hypothetical protein
VMLPAGGLTVMGQSSVVGGMAALAMHVIVMATAITTVTVTGIQAGTMMHGVQMMGPVPPPTRRVVLVEVDTE